MTAGARSVIPRIDRVKALLTSLALVVLVAVLPGQAREGTVDLIEVTGVIDPIVARFVSRAIASAAEHRAQVLILELDTPGGLDRSMREIVQAILASPVPVVAWVAPSGARAGSAGVFITMAAHVAAMAPTTNIGAAHPVSLGRGEIPSTQEAKIVNDAVAYIKGLAARRGRNAEWAEQAVRQSTSIPDAEALRLRVVDLVAEDLQSLLARLDGRKVVTASGEVVLETRGAEVQARTMTVPDQFLHAISDPNLAYLLLILGVWALVAEFYHPGAILPGVTGVICIVLALVAFGSLPVNWAGVGLIVFAVVLFILDLKVTGFGLTVGGAVAFVLGSLILFRPFRPTAPALPRLSVALPLVVAMAAGLVAFFTFVVSKAVRAQRAAVTTGVQALVGAPGRALTPLTPSGTVLVRGEEWSAEAVGGSVPAGEEVHVVGSDGLRLRVARTRR